MVHLYSNIHNFKVNTKKCRFIEILYRNIYIYIKKTKRKILLSEESIYTKIYAFSLFGLQRLAKEAEKYQASHQWRDEFGVSFSFSPFNLLVFFLFEMLNIVLQTCCLYILTTEGVIDYEWRFGFIQ